VWFNLEIAGIFVAFMLVAYLYFAATKAQRDAAAPDAMLSGE